MTDTIDTIDTTERATTTAQESGPAGRLVAAQVDRYTCSQFTLAGFQRLGVDVVQVQNRPDISPAIPDLPYRDRIEGPDDPAELADRLARLNPVCVIAGQEPDVPTADAVSERLGLASNGSAQSLARRNKFEMIDTLRRAGVRCAEQLRASTPDEAVVWAEKNGFPVVVKPLASAATDNVAVCQDAEQVRRAAEAVLASSSIFLEANQEVLVQSYLRGTEYVVDQVSSQHQRYTCGVWEYRKKLIGTHNIYDTEVLVPPDQSPVPELIAYMDQVLTALGIAHGASHAEVIVTEDGPTLVEVGARLSGNMRPDFHDRCQGANQADLTALSYVRPAEFRERWAGRVYEQHFQGWCYSVPTTQSGVVESVDEDVLNQIRSLPTFFRMDLKKQAGSEIEPTVDLHSSIMQVCLAGSTEAEVRRDYERIAQLADSVFILQ